MKRALSLGRIRALQACANAQGIFTILAADHRDPLRAMLNPNAPMDVTAAELTAVKLALVRELAPFASAVLLDPLYSAAQAIAAGALSGHVGLLCALEEQGYGSDPFARGTTLLEGWSVEKAKRLGANGVKILLFYHPDSRAAERQAELVRAVLQDCAQFQIPLFLEPISYSLETRVEKNSDVFARERKRIVIESVRRLGALQPDVLKVEFPLDVKFEKDERAWADACAELNDASPVPWALLSADEPFDVFKRQLRVACENGCSGFLAGRAVWRDAIALVEPQRAEFLRITARERFAELSDIATTYGKAWHTRYAMPSVDENWYRDNSR